ncbi:AmpG family muropeptide MFS transporter [Desulfosediminicola flagellatus]|uniref:AmpG family muropeptide MFS transporter n=1 Tax=Desulfosediminicola flagellatus TaxID=2569541 RepID=UPI0010ABA47C|nr:MFS transporter [Desulfosediminicola flagellatus]
MSQQIGEKPSWKEAFTSWVHPTSVRMLFLGFSAGLPILLIFSTLSLWLREADISRSAVTFFSWAGLGYSFKFIWAPLVDLLPIPYLTRMLGRRRSWILFSQLSIIVAICWMALVDPAASENSLTYMACAAVMLGFTSATQDIVIDAYRIESAGISRQALLASMYFTGYRLAMVVAGAGSLYVSTWFGTSAAAYSYVAWRSTYLVMAAVMLIGVITTLVIPEPQISKDRISHNFSARQYAQILGLFFVVSASFALTFFHSGDIAEAVKTGVASIAPLSEKFVGFCVEVLRFAVAVLVAGIVAITLVKVKLVDKHLVNQTYVLPVMDFFSRYSLRIAIILLLLVGFYRISDIVLGVISNVFYFDVGFSKPQIGAVSKTFGLIVTLIGGLGGGVLTMRYGVNKILFVGALLSSLTNLLFILLAKTGASVSMLIMVIVADNLSGGIAVTAFLAFLSSLTNVSFTAVQYAIFSSVMTLFPKLFGGYSGTISTAIGYESFFLMTACIGIPVLLLVWLVRGEAVN